jgi:hypothetical protein
MGEWQPIKTIPSSKIVELKIPLIGDEPIKGSRGAYPGYWTIERQGHWWTVAGFEPTHWRPLRQRGEASE